MNPNPNPNPRYPDAGVVGGGAFDAIKVMIGQGGAIMATDSRGETTIEVRLRLLGESSGVKSGNISSRYPGDMIYSDEYGISMAQ